jgi:hypothetical protein
MLAFCFVMFAIGALLANVASVRVFAIVALVLAAAGFAQGVYTGWPLGQAALVALGSFVCGQLGYVVGIGFRALVAAKVGHADETDSSKTVKEASFDKSRAAPLNGGH